MSRGAISEGGRSKGRGCLGVLFGGGGRSEGKWYLRGLWGETDLRRSVSGGLRRGGSSKGKGCLEGGEGRCKGQGSEG